MAVKYKDKCTEHGKELDSFCTECMKFICTSCKDEHFFGGKILPSWFIDEYINTLNRQKQQFPNKEQIEIAKKNMIDYFKKIDLDLHKAFNDAVSSLDSFIIKKNDDYDKIINKLKEMKVSDQAVQLLNTISNQQNIYDNSDSLQTMAFQSYAQHTNEIIGSIENIVNQFKNTKQTPVHTLVTNSILHSWSGDTVTIYDISQMTSKKLSINRSIDGAAYSVSWMNRIFFMGNEQLVNENVFELDIKTSSLIQKQSMLCKKYHHCIFGEGVCIYSIGGYNRAVSLNDCETYQILKNIWATLPNLNTPRALCASFAFNHNYIYSLCGHDYSTSTAIKTSERLSINNGIKWELIQITNQFSPRYCFQGIQIKGNEVIVFGAENSPGNESYILTINEKSICCKKGDNMARNCDLCRCSAPIFDGKCVYTTDLNKTVHTYSLANLCWS